MPGCECRSPIGHPERVVAEEVFSGDPHRPLYSPKIRPDGRGVIEGFKRNAGRVPGPWDLPGLRPSPRYRHPVHRFGGCLGKEVRVKVSESPYGPTKGIRVHAAKGHRLRPVDPGLLHAKFLRGDVPVSETLGEVREIF